MMILYDLPFEDDCHRIVVATGDGSDYKAIFYEKMGERWVLLTEEVWADLNELKEEYGID